MKANQIIMDTYNYCDAVNIFLLDFVPIRTGVFSLRNKYTFEIIVLMAVYKRQEIMK